MNEHQESQIADGLREGRVEAWRALYEEYARRVWGDVARMMGPAGASDVADVVQGVFIDAARSAVRFDPGRGTLWNWLSGIARNHVAGHFRKRKQGDPLSRGDGQVAWQIARWLDGGPSPPEALASAELAGLVRQTLTELPADYETVLTAKYMGGASIEELARQTDLSTEAVRSRLARARRAFRRAFSTKTKDTDRMAADRERTP
ncbi:MAG: sigma-70 family RNA polymerase sigma factor [Pirellulales bacterium]|nr:sigma-70 family RNA polymerase sigma factor [Pirellulales bacterium]